MKVFEFTKEESSAIQRLVLEEALNIATVTFQRKAGEGKPYAFEVDDADAFGRKVEETIQRGGSLGQLINQAMRDGTLQGV